MFSAVKPGTSKPTALIFGISGQDGAYLSHLLLSKEYRIVGVTRDPAPERFDNLRRLGVFDRIRLEVIDMTDPEATRRLIERTEPDEIYDLAGQSSVGLSFERPRETFDSIAVRALNILESLRLLRSPARLFHASSTECFGETVSAVDETAPFRPNSPYAVAKASAFWANATYRESYGLYVCSGLLSNHESPLRPERFVTRKIIQAAVRIGQGARERLSLGFLGIRRDWGWAAEYVDAMWRSLQAETPADYLIATGETRSLEDLVALAFARFGLDWHEHVDINPALFRPTEIINAEFDPARARDKLRWTARTRMSEVVSKLTECEIGGGLGLLPWEHAHIA